MADDAAAKQVLTPEGVDLKDLEAALRADFERRTVAIRRKVADLLGHRRDVFAALVGLDDSARHTLLRHVVPNLSGPGTLEGLEALAHKLASAGDRRLQATGGCGQDVTPR